jgi:hypothetical protein
VFAFSKVVATEITSTTKYRLGELAGLVIQNYESFDVEGRVLLPLVKVYLPVE